jgi:hypothetical protein
MAAAGGMLRCKWGTGSGEWVASQGSCRCTDMCLCFCPSFPSLILLKPYPCCKPLVSDA